MSPDPNIENIHRPLMKQYEPFSFDQVLQALRELEPLLGGGA